MDYEIYPEKQCACGSLAVLQFVRTSHLFTTTVLKTPSLPILQWLNKASALTTEIKHRAS